LRKWIFSIDPKQNLTCCPSLIPSKQSIYFYSSCKMSISLYFRWAKREIIIFTLNISKASKSKLVFVSQMEIAQH
jgi:hypothetical protein